MSSPEFGQSVVHIERTPDPAVLRWVVHEPALGSPVARRAEPPVGSVLGALLAEGRLVEVVVAAGAVEVSAADADDWAALVGMVNDELVAELGRRVEWLLSPASSAQIVDRAPSVAEVQKVVAAAAGPITAMHGGSIEVIAVDSTSVTLKMAGACHGCSFTGDTIGRTVAPALKRAFPALVDVRTG